MAILVFILVGYGSSCLYSCWMWKFYLSLLDMAILFFILVGYGNYCLYPCWIWHFLSLSLLDIEHFLSLSLLNLALLVFIHVWHLQSAICVADTIQKLKTCLHCLFLLYINHQVYGLGVVNAVSQSQHTRFEIFCRWSAADCFV